MASTHRDEISRLELLHAAHPEGLVFPHLADAYRRAGRYAQAESLLKAGIRRHANYASAHVVLGRLRLDQGNHESAKQSFRRVLDLEPQNAVALEYLGRLSVDQGRLQEALDHYRRLYRVKPAPEVLESIRALERRVAEARRARAEPPRRGPGDLGRGGGDNGGDAVRGGSLRSTREAGVPGRIVAPSPTSPVPPVRPARPEPGGRRDVGRPSGGDRTAGPRPGTPGIPEPGEVVTETMAELYSRQGLHERSVAVYRQLVQRKPGDPRLVMKLREAEIAAGLRDGGDPAPASGPSIREHLKGMLSWRPAGPVGAGPVLGRAESGAGADSLPGARTSPAAPQREARDERARPREPDRGTSDRPGAFLVDSVPESEAGATRSAPLVALTDMLVGLLEYRDPFFRGSTSLTRLLASSVAEELELGETERVDLELAAVLRDLGRLAMGGRLTKQVTDTPENRRKIERHVHLALHLLEGIDVPAPVRLAVRHHHERWDGNGYPDGLAGEAIPRLARVLSVVDSFAAMVSPRPYRLPRKVPDAARELREAAGTQYEAEVVDALLRVLARRDQPSLGYVQRHHILLVDPDQPGAVVTAAKLCSAGYLAEVAADTEVARERLHRVPVAGLVVSAQAGDDTAAFVRELRVDPLFASLPIVVIDAEGVGLRVRLLESGADVCFPPGIAYAELQGTLGALVRRTIRTSRGDPASTAAEAPWLALQGDIQDFPLTWLLQVMKYDSRTAAIGIRTSTHEGAIYLERGDAVHARIRGGEKGELALHRMLGWKKGRFTVQPDARPREKTIDTSIMHLLLTQAVDEDHAEAGIFGAVSADA
jgi:HD-GYP domain-containing protein (c-di-GMP phosphodiesterase class II)